MTLLRKHGLWLVIATLAGIVGVLLLYKSKPVQYTSTSQVDVEAHIVANTTPVVPNMGTEAQVATSGVVVSGTARALGITPGSLSSALSAKVSGTANILSINCTLRTPQTAQRCAAAAAAAYTAFRNDVTASPLERAHDPLVVTLVTVASLPTAPAGPGRKILVPLGAFLGLMLGLGGVVVRDHLDGRVRDRADLERCLEAPVMAEVPRIRRRSVNPAFAFARAPLSAAAESYRYLRAHLDPLISDTPDGGAVVLVASPRPREGRTSVAANLATALAHAGDRVILIDADLRHPSLDRLFGTGERRGLADLLADRASLEEVAVPTDVPGLRLVTTGDAVSVADPFEAARLSRAVARMKTAANVIVVDSAPVLAVSDAVTVARLSDLVVMVADVRRTSRDSVMVAAQQMRAAGPQIIIGVLNYVPRPFLSGQTRNIKAGPQSLAPAASVPAVLASAVPPRGPNGQGRRWPDAATAAGRGRLGVGTGSDEDPPPAPDAE
jgi:capsular exopolysaccharide synthesis family protein